MDWTQVIVLSLLQGLSEFLPISSSAHLIVVPRIFGWDDQGLAFDVVVHSGTLLAVVYYFRHRIRTLGGGFYQSLQTRSQNEKSLQVWGILLATVPVAAVGFFLEKTIDAHFRNLEIIAAATLVFALVLGFSDGFGKRKTHQNLSDFVSILIIGCAQIFALIPGASRSGVTISAALLLGLSRRKSAEISFLLSIPVIALSLILMLQNLVRTPEPVAWDFLLFGFLLSAVAAYLTIDFFIRIIEKIGLLPFVFYRLALGIFLLFL